jgi:hypothetical protein
MKDPFFEENSTNIGSHSEALIWYPDFCLIHYQTDRWTDRTF